MPGPVFLRGESVELRTIEPEDAEFLAAVLNDPRVREGIGADHPYPVSSEREWIESLDEHNPEGVNLLVCTDGDPIGVLGVEDVVPRWGTGEVGYMLEPGAWNEGYATDAVRTVAAYVFDELRFERLAADVYETNEASARVLEKVGFQQEGTQRSHAFADGKRVDLHRYGLLAEEFEP